MAGARAAPLKYIRNSFVRNEQWRAYQRRSVPAPCDCLGFHARCRFLKAAKRDCWPEAQVEGELQVVAQGGFTFEQQREPFGCFALAYCFNVREGLRHPVEAKALSCSRLGWIGTEISGPSSARANERDVDRGCRRGSA